MPGKSLYRLLPLLILSAFIMSCSKEEQEEEENLRETMLYEVNKIRRNGCLCGDTYMPPARELIWNEHLETAAFLHAKDMYENNYFSHLSQNGFPPIMRAHAAGYTGNVVSENIARGYFKLDKVLNGWLNSESHCQNLMDDSYFELGAGRYQDHWVQKFGIPGD